MKISVQEKIAELESKVTELERRIAALEGRTATFTRVTSTSTIDEPAVFGEHWRKMWDEFNLVMKDVFK